MEQKQQQQLLELLTDGQQGFAPAPRHGQSSALAPAVVGAGVGAEFGESPGTPRGATVRTRVGKVASASSSWRLPRAPGRRPRYVQRKFRLKALGLVSLQLCTIVAMMLAIRQLDLRSRWSDAMMALLLALMALAAMAVFEFSRSRAVYPTNYVLLVFVTLLAGLAWGIAGELLPAEMHLQIMGIICVTFMTVIVAMDSSLLVVIAMPIIWVAALVLLATGCRMTDRSDEDGDQEAGQAEAQIV